MRLSIFLAALLGALLPACGGSGAPEGPPPDVLLVVIDTLRADGLSCYGNPRPTSPELDRLAAEGVRFAEVLSQAPDTATSHATLFTGLHPWTHRVANLAIADQLVPGLASGFTTLAERFRDAGYRTVAFTDGGPLGRAWNLDQGFDLLRGAYEGVAAKVDQALAELRRPRGDRPLFLFLHTYEVHQPFAPPAGWVERFDPGYEGPLTAPVEEIRRRRAAGEEVGSDAKLVLADLASFTERDHEHLRALYDAGIAYTDAELGRLWTFLREQGRLDDTLVVVTSDHGEEFGEHGRHGHRQLYRETLSVPLIVRGGMIPPDARGRVVPGRVGLVDLFPTLLEAVGLAPGGPVDGRSLWSAVRGGEPAAVDYFAETTEHLYIGRPEHPWQRAVRRGDDVLISVLRGSRESAERYDLAADPAEQQPLPMEGETATTLARRLVDHLRDQDRQHQSLFADFPPEPRVRADAATVDELEKLGYVERD